jgi:hypothetical protein
MALSWKNITVARTNCGADVFGLAGFLRDDDLIWHDGSCRRRVVWLQPFRYLQQLLDRSVDSSEWPVFPEFHRACSDAAALMCGTWTRASARRWLSKTWPQRQVILELGFCDGIRLPACHIAYLRAVQSRCARQVSKSASVRLERNTRHAASKSARAWSKVAAVPSVHSPG